MVLRKMSLSTGSGCISIRQRTGLLRSRKSLVESTTSGRDHQIRKARQAAGTATSGISQTTSAVAYPTADHVPRKDPVREAEASAVSEG